MNSYFSKIGDSINNFRKTLSKKNRYNNVDYNNINSNTNKISKVSNKLIKKCNKILIKKEQSCQCFNNKNYPTNKFRGCMLRNNNRKCKNYNKCKRILSGIMSGTEPEYNPKYWSNPLIEGSHNCYAYMLDDQMPHLSNKCLSICKNKGYNNYECRSNKNKVNNCSNLKPQPGNYALQYGNLKKKERIYKCPNMIKKVLSDNYDKKTKKSVVIPVKFSERCPKNYYKGALVVDKGKTYHFYRQDSNVRYSHKQGTLSVENVDASKNPIYVPHLSNMDFSRGRKNGINYDAFCSYFCIPRNYYKDTYST
jgi:hypothetical protein